MTPSAEIGEPFRCRLFLFLLQARASERSETVSFIEYEGTGTQAETRESNGQVRWNGAVNSDRWRQGDNKKIKHRYLQ